MGEILEAWRENYEWRMRGGLSCDESGGRGVIEAEYNESTLAWIAEQLRMAPRTYLAHLLNWNRRKK
jgi:hypothetical protein